MTDSCILLKFYIKPQLSFSATSPAGVVSYWNSTSNHNYRGKKRVVIALYLIEILHQTTTVKACRFRLRRCILLKFYIKPQPISFGSSVLHCCILLKFYIKPQPFEWYPVETFVVSYWNSTSNHNLLLLMFSPLLVVSYWNSTSNHNSVNGPLGQQGVVSYWNSTSNHNNPAGR